MKNLKKKILDISQKKFGSAYAQSPQKCSTIEILAKIEGKEAKFFSKICEGHIRIWFRSKKNSKLSHACVPLTYPPPASGLSIIIFIFLCCWILSIPLFFWFWNLEPLLLLSLKCPNLSSYTSLKSPYLSLTPILPVTVFSMPLFLVQISFWRSNLRLNKAPSPPLAAK